MSDIYKQLSDAVIQMKPQLMRELADQVLQNGIPAEDAIQNGLAVGMNEVGRLFSCKEYFVPEVLVCAKTMYIGFDILKPRVLEGAMPSKGTIVTGVVEGDFHDIGKNIVKLMLEASGFKIIDIGKNISSDKFLKAVRDEDAQMAALSTLMTTTMENMEETVHLLKAEAPDVKIMIGGAPVNEDFAVSAGAHFYGEDADSAVQGAHKLLGTADEK